MTEIVPASDIERIVGVNRHPTIHYARAVSAREMVYILHSHACLASGIDLRDCEFSIALDRGIDHPEPRTRWRRVLDRPVRVQVIYGWLLPDLMALREGRLAPPLRPSMRPAAGAPRPAARAASRPARPAGPSAAGVLRLGIRGGSDEFRCTVPGQVLGLR